MQVDFFVCEDWHENYFLEVIRDKSRSLFPITKQQALILRRWKSRGFVGWMEEDSLSDEEMGLRFLEKSQAMATFVFSTIPLKEFDFNISMYSAIVDAAVHHSGEDALTAFRAYVPKESWLAVINHMRSWRHPWKGKNDD